VFIHELLILAKNTPINIAIYFILFLLLLCENQCHWKSFVRFLCWHFWIFVGKLKIWISINACHDFNLARLWILISSGLKNAIVVTRVFITWGQIKNLCPFVWDFFIIFNRPPEPLLRSPPFFTPLFSSLVCKCLKTLCHGDSNHELDNNSENKIKQLKIWRNLPKVS